MTTAAERGRQSGGIALGSQGEMVELAERLHACARGRGTIEARRTGAGEMWCVEVDGFFDVDLAGEAKRLLGRSSAPAA